MKQEADSNGFFDDHVRVREAVAMDDDGNFMNEIGPQVFFFCKNHAMDIAMVDDDNKSSPLNISHMNAPKALDN